MRKYENIGERRLIAIKRVSRACVGTRRLDPRLDLVLSLWKTRPRGETMRLRDTLKPRENRCNIKIKRGRTTWIDHVNLRRRGYTHWIILRLFALKKKKKKKKGERQDDEYSLGRRRIVYNCVYLSSVIYLAYIFPIRFKQTGGQICFDDGDKSGNGVE